MPAAADRKFVRIGRIIGAHGLRGEVKVAPCTEERANLLRYRRVFLSAPEDGEKREFAVSASRLSGKDRVILHLSGCVNRDEAEALRAGTLWLSTDDLPPLAQGEYYLHELIGKCACLRTSGKSFGRIEAVLDTAAAQSLLVVRDGEHETLVPAVAALITHVDDETVVFDLPEGLLALEADA